MKKLILFPVILLLLLVSIVLAGDIDVILDKTNCGDLICDKFIEDCKICPEDCGKCDISLSTIFNKQGDTIYYKNLQITPVLDKNIKVEESLYDVVVDDIKQSFEILPKVQIVTPWTSFGYNLNFDPDSQIDKTCSGNQFYQYCKYTQFDDSVFISKNNITSRTVKKLAYGYYLGYIGLIYDLDPSLYEIYTTTSFGYFNQTEATNLGVRLLAPTFYMNFDEVLNGNTIMDDSLNNIQLYGAAVYNTTNLRDGTPAYSFNGTSGLYAANRADFNPTKLITLSSWVNKKTLSASAQIINKQDQANNARQYVLYFGSDTHLTCAFSSTGTSYDKFLMYDITTAIPSGEWHHVACVNGNTNMSLYIDGTKVNSSSSVSSLLSNSERLAIGCYDAGTGCSNNYYEGSLDDVMLFSNIGLDDSQIMMLYNNGSRKYTKVGEYMSPVWYNSTSSYWNITLNTIDSSSTKNTPIINSDFSINKSYQGLAQYFSMDEDYIIVDDMDSGFIPSAGWTKAIDTSNRNLNLQTQYALAGTGSINCRWEFRVPETGDYNVYAIWMPFSNRVTNAPYTVTHAGGTSAYSVDQRAGSSEWYLLGSHTFNAGTTYNVNLTNNALAANYVIADAILVTKKTISMNNETVIYKNNSLLKGSALSSTGMVFNGAVGTADAGRMRSFINDSRSLSVSAWVKPTGSFGTYNTIVSKYGSKYVYYFGLASGRPYFAVYTAGTSATGVTSVNSSELSLNQWYHITATWNASNITNIYVNGVNVSTTQVKSLRAPEKVYDYNNDNSANTIVGAVEASATTTPGYYFNGNIDEVAVYNVTLNQDDVNGLFLSGLEQHANTNITLQTRTADSYNISDSQLLAFYPLNNNLNGENGTVAVDMTGRYNGTIVNLTFQSNNSVISGSYINSTKNPSFINISQYTFSTNTGNFSVSAWVKLMYLESGAGYATYFRSSDCAGGNPAAFEVLLQDYNGYGFRIFTCGACGWQVPTTYTGGTYSYNTWHHIVHIMDNSGLKETVYVDGVNASHCDSAYLPRTLVRAYIGGYGRNFNGNIDEVRIYNRTLSSNEIVNLYQLGSYHINWSDWTDQGVVSDGMPKNISSAKFMQYKAIFNTNDSYSSPYLLNYSVTNINLIYPTVSNIRWKTTGGFTSSNLMYDMALDYINATCEITDLTTIILGCNITVTAPDSTVVVNNIPMTNSSSEYTYNTDIQLNQAGSWLISITGYTNMTAKTETQTISVSTVSPTISNHIYGYKFDSIPQNNTITDNSFYDFNILEFNDLASTFEQNWSLMLSAIRKANSLNQKVGITYTLDYNLSSNGLSRDKLIANITLHYASLLNSTYIQTVQYLKFNINITEQYSDTNITTDNINKVGKAAFQATNNQFVIYSQYNSSTLDTDYLGNSNDIKYVTGRNATLINTLANLSKTLQTKKRMYYNLTEDNKLIAKEYQNNIIVPSFSNFNITTTSQHSLVSEFEDGGFIVYNNLSTPLNISYNLSNCTNAIGYDIWDYTDNIYLQNNSNGTIPFLALQPFSFKLIGTQMIDKFVMDSLISAVVYESTPSQIYTGNLSDGSGEAARDLSIARAIELWDDSYKEATSSIYYGWLNSSEIMNPYSFDGLNYLIIADKNDEEIDILFNGSIEINQSVYGYIAVADYDSSVTDCSNETWVAEKKVEVDEWILLNGSMNIFIDGFDLGNVHDNGCFFNDVKNVTDYIKLAKNKEVGVNVFTNYQEFSELASINGFAMIESCTHKWFYNITGDSSFGYNYTKQYWEDFNGYGDYNKSIWYSTHNVNVICVPFIDRPSTASQPSNVINGTDRYHNSSYWLMEKLYLKAKVLGYDEVVMGHPLFNLRYFDKYKDVGTKLQSQPTKQNDLYYMRYSNGIVYYNSTSDNAWFDDGATFNNGTIHLDLYDAAPYTFPMCINDYCDYTVMATATGWTPPTDYPTFEMPFNSTVFSNAYGHYVIRIYSPDGGYIAADEINYVYGGKHSFYDNSGVWAMEGDGYGNEVIALRINKSFSNSIDSTDSIVQTETTTSQKVTRINITSTYPIFKPIESYVSSGTGRFNNLKIFNGTYVKTNYLSTISCSTLNPSFLYSDIPGVGSVGVCIDNSTSTINSKVQFPYVLERAYEINLDDIIPTFTINYPTETQYYLNTYTGNINITVDEDSLGCYVNDSRWKLQQITNSTPVMTSDNTPSGISSAFSVYGAGYEAYRAFDQDITTLWHSTGSLPQWLMYQFDSAKTIKHFMIVPRGATVYPVDFTMGASNDGINFDIIGEYKVTDDWTADPPTNTGKTFPIYSPNTYVYYRLNVTESSGAGSGPGGYTNLAELVLYEEIYSPNKTNFALQNISLLTSQPIVLNVTCYDEGSNQNSKLLSFEYVFDTTPPEIIFNYQAPIDLNLTNFIGPEGLNISYNITDNVQINNETIHLFYKVNSTQDNIMYYQNGISHSGYFPSTPIYNTTPSYTWKLFDNNVLPGTYNYGQITLENTVHLSSTLIGANNYLSVNLINVSNSKRYSFYEMMINRSSGTGSLRFYYCNSTYGFADSPAGNTNCALFYTLTSNVYNHCHNTYSCHMLAPFTVNDTLGTIGTVKVTDSSYFIARGIGGTTWKYYHIPGLTGRTNTFRYSSNNGAAWSDNSTQFTIDAHLHQFGTNTSLYYYACANDTSNNENCTTVREDLLELGGLAPTVIVSSPIETLYDGNVSINYTAESPNGYEISNYTIDLLNTDYTLNRSILSTTTEKSYLWDTKIEGEYIIRVTAYDSLNQIGYGYSENFTIDSQEPMWTLIAANLSILNTTQINSNFTATDFSTITYSINDTRFTMTSGNVINNTILPIGNHSVAVYANDTLGNSNMTVWNVEILGVAATPVVPSGGGAAGGPANPGVNLPPEDQLAEKVGCVKQSTFIARLRDTCKDPTDGVCNDGETPIKDKDCLVTADSLSCKKGCTFREIWFAKILLIILIVLLLSNRKDNWIWIGLIGLFIAVNFIVGSLPTLKPILIPPTINNSITSISGKIIPTLKENLLNIGSKIIPTSPEVGAALIVVAGTALLIPLFRGGKKWT